MISFFQICFLISSLITVAESALKSGQIEPLVKWNWKRFLILLFGVFGLFTVGFFSKFQIPQIVFCILMILGLIGITKNTFNSKASTRKHDPYYTLFVTVILQTIYYYGGVYDTFYQNLKNIL
jgi:hypothetical protein